MSEYHGLEVLLGHEGLFRFVTRYVVNVITRGDRHPWYTVHHDDIIVLYIPKLKASIRKVHNKKVNAPLLYSLLSMLERMDVASRGFQQRIIAEKATFQEHMKDAFNININYRKGIYVGITRKTIELLAHRQAITPTECSSQP